LTLKAIDELRECRKCGIHAILSEDGRCVDCWDRDIEAEYENVDIICPYCGCAMIQKRGRDNGKQLYQCKGCHKKFREQYKQIREDVKCTKCGSFNTIRKGWEKGNQIYKCKSCGKKFRLKNMV